MTAETVVVAVDVVDGDNLGFDWTGESPVVDCLDFEARIPAFQSLLTVPPS